MCKEAQSESERRGAVAERRAGDSRFSRASRAGPARGRSAVRAARRRRVVRHLAGARGLLRVLREARARPPARGGGVARGRLAKRHGSAVADAGRQRSTPISCRRCWRRIRRSPRSRWSICRPTDTSCGNRSSRAAASIPETAATVGRQLASIHAAFAKSPTAAVEFDTGASFHALRIEPYLLATARAHPDLASILEIARRANRADEAAPSCMAMSARRTFCLGARGPVFLDAECAWFGDPAFDLAFCLNHLLLKTLWVPSAERELLASFDALADAYLRGVDWEPAAALEQRAAQLLPALFLARVDGKSPVEYLTDDASKNAVRRAARSMLQQPLDRLDGVRRAWAAKRRSGRRPIVSCDAARSDRTESSAGACGIHEAGRRSKRRSCSRVA